MYDKLREMVDSAEKILVVQAENPDGDSLGSALALEEVLGDLGKEVHLYCPVDIPKYLRYMEGWSRVSSDFYFKADLVVIVDTAADVLLSKLMDDAAIRNVLETRSVLVIDHHMDAEPDLKFEAEIILEEAVATCELLFRIFKDLKWAVNAEAARCLFAGIMSDTLGLASQNVTSETYRVSAELIDLGANVVELEEARRALMKKSREILAYKGKLIERVEYFLDGKLAVVHIPWEEIREYSDQYNPNVLIQEELRLVEGVEVSVAIKTYPDGKLTGKVRSEAPVAGMIAGYFGGGGHERASGFRVYDMGYEEVLRDLVRVVGEALENRDSENA
ncbi:DHH family phosphoesterase [Candidatus Saccharibacteria bacterium]|nr:DHH family phosphoesterase [Candidatus Saccharibacteria bacterium]